MWPERKPIYVILFRKRQLFRFHALTSKTLTPSWTILQHFFINGNESVES